MASKTMITPTRNRAIKTPNIMNNLSFGASETENKENILIIIKLTKHTLIEYKFTEFPSLYLIKTVKN